MFGRAMRFLYSIVRKARELGRGVSETFRAITRGGFEEVTPREVEEAYEVLEEAEETWELLEWETGYPPPGYYRPAPMPLKRRFMTKMAVWGYDFDKRRYDVRYVTITHDYTLSFEDLKDMAMKLAEKTRFKALDARPAEAWAR